MKTRFLGRCPLPLSLPFLLFPAWLPPAAAQSLAWEGQTGAVFSPTAHLALSPDRGLGQPVISFHVLDAGEVLGLHFQTSVTLGIRGRVELGITRSSVASVGDEAVASLFDRGFTTFHAKIRLLAGDENHPAMPSISAGALVRWQQEHIGADIIPSDPTQNGDLYLAVTKNLPLSPHFDLQVTAGARGTNAVFFGVAGNAPSWELRTFGSGGIVVDGRLMIGGEVVQHPTHLDAFPGARMPSTTAFFARILPMASDRMSLDLALVSVAGMVQPDLDLKAENRLAAGWSFRF